MMINNISLSVIVIFVKGGRLYSKRISLWIVGDLKNEETTFFKAAASQLQESRSRFIKLHTSAWKGSATKP